METLDSNRECLLLAKILLTSKQVENQNDMKTLSLSRLL
jgi:hypothetical protein